MTDRLFARFIGRHDDHGEEGIAARSGRWLMQQVMQGDSCLNITACAGRHWWGDEQAPLAPAAEPWCSALLASPCVAVAGGYAPMILDGDRLYLRRDEQAEAMVASDLLARLAQPVAHTPDPALLAELFDGQLASEQCQAVANAASQRFAVICGGPGTGKTTSLIRLLLYLLAADEGMRIHLAAPTGKAAARMLQALRTAAQHLQGHQSLRARLPDQATTLHRLLAYDGRRFRLNEHQPLATDCLVVDEASMMDLAMMQQLLRALPQQARLILLGDHHQLPSVEAGNVLADIVGAHHRSQPGDMPDIARATAFLHTPYRFAADSGIARLAEAVRQGHATAAIDACRQAEHDITWKQHIQDAEELLQRAVDAFACCYAADAPAAVLAALEQLRLLTPLHDGRWGTRWLNRQIAAKLQQRTCINATGHGRFIMITRNHPSLDVYNGDTGLLWQEGETCDACFANEDGSIRRIPRQLLPEWVDAWAMTVHKAQGSEYDTVWLVLPSEAQPALLDRALLYTAITRARARLILFAEAETIRRCVERKNQRSTGLAQRLGWKMQNNHG